MINFSKSEYKSTETDSKASSLSEISLSIFFELYNDITNIMYDYLEECDKIKIIKSNPEKKFNFFLHEQYNPSYNEFKDIPFHYYLNIIIDDDKLIDKLPSTLKILEIGKFFEGTLTQELPEDLLELHLSSKYNKPITKFPEKLQKLNLGSIYNIPLPTLPKSLIHLNLGWKYNHHLYLPDSLEELIVNDYKKKLPEKLPEKLQYLKIFLYKEKLPTLPSNLKTLITISYTEDLPTLPESLEKLKLGFYDNDSINLPSSLKYLDLGAFYNHPLPNTLPPRLQTLILNQYFNQPLPNKLPETLEILELGDFYNIKLPKKLPTRLRKISLGLAYKHKLPKSNILEISVNGISCDSRRVSYTDEFPDYEYYEY